MALKDNMITEWVTKNGIGGIDVDRMTKSIEQYRRHLRLQGEEAGGCRHLHGEFLPPPPSGCRSKGGGSDPCFRESLKRRGHYPLPALPLKGEGGCDL